MMSYPKVLHTADWHLGHNRVPTEDTADGIRKYLFPRLAEVDMLLIVGDVFDGIVDFNDSEASVILELLADVMMNCHKHNVILRIVRGTFSHDRLQMGIIDGLYRKLGIPINYAQIASMTIEHIDSLDIDILYVPDNLPYSNKNDVLVEIRKLLVANNLKTVHYVAIHGEFVHMAFGNDVYNTFSTDDFKDICSGLLLAGHIHKPHRKDNLIYAGSFNRLAHNEEEAKGFWIVQGNKASFVENPESTRLITVDYRDESKFDDMLVRHSDLVKIFGTEKVGFLRLIMTDVNLKQAIASYHNANYPNIKLTFKTNQKRDVDNDRYLREKLTQQRKEIWEVPSEKNIASIIYNHLVSTHGVDISISIIEELVYV